MFAIVDILGFQEKVEQGAKLSVPIADKKVGDSLTFDKVLLVSDGGSVTMGAPFVSGVTVEAKVLAFGKTDKVRTTKFKRRKRYLKFSSHRQNYMEIEITSIGGSKKKEKKAE